MSVRLRRGARVVGEGGGTLMFGFYWDTTSDSCHPLVFKHITLVKPFSIH